MEMEINQATVLSSGREAINIVEGGLSKFATDLPVLAFVPRVELSDLQGEQRAGGKGMRGWLRSLLAQQ